MPSPATDDQVPTFDDLGDTNDSGSISESSSCHGSDSGHEFGYSTKAETGTNNPPLSRDELLAYLENMRRRFSTKPTSDAFADQDEEVMIVTPKKKSGLIRHPNTPQLMRLPGIYQS